MSKGMQLFKLRFKTAGKTIEDIKAMYDFSPPPQETLERIVVAYQALDGMEVVGAKWDYRPDNYSIYGWNEEEDHKMKEFIYLMEQDEMFGSYFDSRKEFDEDWEKGEYEPSAPMHFPTSDFEVIEKIERKAGEGSE